MVHLIFSLKQQLGYGDYRVSVCQQELNDPRQSFRRMQRGIVEQHYASRLDTAGHTLMYLRGRQILPVKAVPTGNGFKAFGNERRGCFLYLPPRQINNPKPLHSEII